MNFRHSLTALAVLSTVSFPLKAAEWSLQPAVGAAMEYGDNVSLTPGFKDDYWRLLVVPSLDVARQSSNTQLSLNTFLDFKYSRDDALSDNSQRTYLRYNYDLERHALGIKGFFKRESVLRNITNEIDSDDIEGSDLDDADTSLLQESSKRTVLDLKPYWSWRLSELDTLRLQYRFLNTKYSGDSLSDNRVDSLTASLSHTLTEKLDALLILSGSRYNDVDNNKDVDNRQIDVGVDYKFSEKSAARAQIGLRDSRSQSEDSSGIVYQVTGFRKTEVGSLNILARRNVRSSGKEVSVLADELKVWWKNKIRPTVDFSIYLNAYQNRALTGDASSQTYFGIQPRLIWQLSLEWAASFSYEFRRLEDGKGVAADGNSVSMAISYALPKLFASR